MVLKKELQFFCFLQLLYSFSYLRKVQYQEELQQIFIRIRIRQAYMVSAIFMVDMLEDTVILL
jgi:hypothetical protein